MLHKNIIKLAALLWCVLTVASCTNEDFDKGSSGPDVPKGLPVTLKLNIGTPDVPVVETKALDNGTQFGSINNLAVLVYNEKGENPIVTYVPGLNGGTEVTGIKFNAKTGKYKIYVLTNVGSEDAANAYTTERALLAAQFESAAPGGGEMMLGFVSDKSYADSRTQYDSGQNNVIDITGDGDYYAKVVPPYSKITFKITKNLPSDKHVYLAITEVNVRNLPVKYSLLPYQNWAIGDVSTGTSNLYKNASAKPEEEVGELATGKNFYMFENLQGVNNTTGNTDPMLKTPAGLTVPTSEDGKIDYATWFQKWTTVPCTYIEVKGHYTIFTSEGKVNHVGDGEINYRFFLGENSTSDFNIKRNTHYNVTLAFTDLAGKNELQYEWRVQADLAHSTFYPKGTLVIDGAVSPVGSVPFYVLNGTSTSLSISVPDLTNMDMEMYYLSKGDRYNPDYWTGGSTPDASVLQVGAEAYSMFGIHPRNIGILGSYGHTSGTNKYVYVGGGNDMEYNKISSNAKSPYREAVANGQIYRTVSMSITGTEVLEVKEYPLLYLGTATDKIGIGDQGENNFYYARRVDGGARYFQDQNDNYVQKYIPVVGKLSSMSDAKVNCSHEKFVSGVSINYYLPSISDMKNIQKYERAFPLKNDFYWTTDGLYNPVTGATASSGEGYIRCILKHK